MCSSKYIKQRIGVKSNKCLWVSLVLAETLVIKRKLCRGSWQHWPKSTNHPASETYFFGSMSSRRPRYQSRSITNYCSIFNKYTIGQIFIWRKFDYIQRQFPKKSHKIFVLLFCLVNIEGVSARSQRLRDAANDSVCITEWTRNWERIRHIVTSLALWQAVVKRSATRTQRDWLRP